MTKQLNNAAVLSKINAAPSADERMAQARAEYNARNAKKQATPAPEAQVADEPIVGERAASAIGAMMEELKLPSFTRVIVGCVLGLVVAAGFGYLFGYVLGALMIGAFAMSGSVFIANTIYVLGLIYAFFKGGKLGVRTASYVISGRIDETFGGVTSTISGWFKRQPQVIQVVQAAQPFTGAFTAPAAA